MVCVNEDGRMVPAVWPSAHRSHFYAKSIENMRRRVSRAKITELVVARESELGVSQRGGWGHFSVKNPAPYTARVRDAHEFAAEKREHFRTLSYALSGFRVEDAKAAYSLLKNETLANSSVVVGVAKFIFELMEELKSVPKDRKDNIVWKRVAVSPAGFCTPRSSMYGTLMDDLRAGLSVDDIKRKFGSKMHPARYMRPQEDASEGNIKRANEIFEKLGLEPALRRRFATLEELQLLWSPTSPEPEKAKSGGAFSSLKPRGAPTPREDIRSPRTNITWDKFRRTVLPEAQQIWVRFNYGSWPLGAITTAVNADAPPLLQWDTEEQRNPFSYYVYTNGSSALDWNLTNSAWIPVDGVSLMPSMWNGRETHHVKHGFLVLNGAKDRRKPGLAIFPTFLKAELHEVRRTIEQFSQANKMEGIEEASAAGLLVGQRPSPDIRVKTRLGEALYCIDRWD